MSIADKITSITGHLEDDYTALETLGVSVEDRNIENIKDMANQIYAKFPKTSYAEGSNIALENCLKGKLDYEDGKVGYGDTLQEGEPTPTTPIRAIPLALSAATNCFLATPRSRPCPPSAS